MQCRICGREQVPGVRFCSNCGWAAAPRGDTVAAAAVSGPAGGASPAGVAGKAGEALRSVQGVWEKSPRLQAFIRRGLAEPGGLRGFVLVAAVCLVLTLLLWGPLSLPATWINAALVKWITPRSCEAWGLLAEVCAYATAVMTWLGSALVLALVYLFRKPLNGLLQAGFNRLPGDVGFLAAPVVSTVLFTMVWAGNSFHWWTRPGLVRDGLFPVLIGLLTHLIIWHGPGLQRRLAGLLERRDRMSFKARLGLLFVVMYGIALVTTNLLSPPVSDQSVTLLGVVIGYLLLAPRRSDAAKEARGS